MKGKEKRGKEPREKKNGIGGVWGKLKRVGAPDREKLSGGNGECLDRGNMREKAGKKKEKKGKGKIQKKKKSREIQEPLKLRRAPKYARTRFFVEVEPPQFPAADLRFSVLMW